MELKVGGFNFVFVLFLGSLLWILVLFLLILGMSLVEFVWFLVYMLFNMMEILFLFEKDLGCVEVLVFFFFKCGVLGFEVIFNGILVDFNFLLVIFVVVLKYFL